MHRVIFGSVVILALSAAAAAQSGDKAARQRATSQAQEWFAAAAGQKPRAPVFAGTLSADNARALVPLLWRARCDAARAAKVQPLQLPEGEGAVATSEPATIAVGDKEFPFVIVRRGERPDDGWPLFLCMHGGGGNGRAKGPHAWNVNTREWQAQRMLAQRYYEPAGLYFVPRMADDRLGRWWHDHNQVAFDRVIDAALLLHGVDPDRVYLTGISEGGYGAIRFAGNLPDRFAAIGGMAAAEPLGTSPPENMRNVAFRIDIGERDTQFDRVGLARRMGERLDELRAADPEGYLHVVNVQKGKGHGIDYRPTPRWLAQHTRRSRPDRVVWTVRRFHRRVALQRYWLALDAAPEQLPASLDARIERTDAGGRVTVTTRGFAGRLRIRLDDELLDLDRPITVVVDGEERVPVTVQRSLEVMLRTLAQRADPRACYCAELVVDVEARD